MKNSPLRKLYKVFLALMVLFFSMLSLQAQTKYDDFGRIILNAYIPDSINLPSEAKVLLKNKLASLATSNGIGGSTVNPRFIITATYSVLSKDIIPGPPQMLAYTLDYTFYIMDASEMKIFVSTSIEIKGVGLNENKAHIEAIKNINIKNKELASFIEEGKNRIKEYYNSNCDFIVRNAMILSNNGDYDGAILKLAIVPEACESCYTKCLDFIQNIYQQKIDRECQLIIRHAKTAWMANQNSTGAAKVAEIINSISPFSSCELESNQLIAQVQSQLKNEEKTKWEFQVQKHNDAIKLKTEALRIDEEDRQRKSALLKEAQRQNYALQKSEQEADGFRGFVNAVAKLKIASWASESHSFLNEQTIDYSKIKFK